MKNFLKLINEEERERILNLHSKVNISEQQATQSKIPNPITNYTAQVDSTAVKKPVVSPTTQQQQSPTTTTTTTIKQQPKQYTDKYIKEIQTKLVGMGFNLGNSGPQKNGVDGAFGPITSKAIYDLLSRYQESKTQQSVPANIQPKPAQQIQSQPVQTQLSPAQPQQ